MYLVYGVLLLINVDCIFGQIHVGGETIIRHSRSRLLRGRRHGDEGHEAPTGNVSYQVQKTTETPAGNVSVNLEEEVKLVTVNKTSIGKKKLSGLKRVTVGSNSGNNSWQHMDKSVLYMGERALNQIDNKKKNKTSQGPRKDGQDDNDQFTESTFIDIDDESSSMRSASTEIAPRSGHVDIVTRFLRIVESQHLLGENCTAGTDLNLGEGVVDRYAQERFRIEADVAVNRANMLTRLWKYADPHVVLSEYLLHASVFSMVEFDDDIFAAGNCYDQYQYKDYLLFCPYAYRLPEGTILVKDLAVEYNYLSNTSEWFYIARKNAENVIKNFNQFSRGMVIFSCIKFHHF